MRWAIRRLVSRGKSVKKPRAVRDSEAIQDTIARKSWDQPLPPSPPPPPPSRNPPRQAGQRWPQFGHQGGGALEGTLGSLNLMENISNRRKPWRDGKCGARTRPRSPSLSETGHTPRNPDIRRTTTSSRRRRETKARVGTSRVRGPRSQKEPGFSSSGKTEVNSDTAEHTTSRIALCRRILSPPQPHERAYNSPHKEHAES